MLSSEAVCTSEAHDLVMCADGPRWKFPGSLKRQVDTGAWLWQNE